MLRAASVPLTTDLRSLLAVLRVQGVQVRVSEEAGEQVVWARDERDVEAVTQALVALERGEIARAAEGAAQARRGLGDTLEGPNNAPLVNQAAGIVWRLARFSRRCPLTASLVLATLIVALLSRNGRDVAGVAMLFFPALPFVSATDLFLQLLSPWLLLRSVTPALLHLGELHLVFNLLWLLYFGRQLERVQPTVLVLVVYMLTAFAGNFVQYYTGGSAAFGGLSGLIYGLVGYTWLLGVMAPSSGVQLRTSTFAVFVIALLAMAIFASDSIASGAHLGGLVAGLACAAIVKLGYTLRRV